MVFPPFPIFLPPFSLRRPSLPPYLLLPSNPSIMQQQQQQQHHPDIASLLMNLACSSLPPHDLPSSPPLDPSHSVIIVGAGPSGMATAACLKTLGIPFIILERAGCIASLWKERTYDRLKLHIAKEYCKLPLMPLPDSFPVFVTRQQFVSYLEQYAAKFELKPRFDETVQSACYDESSRTWQVYTTAVGPFAEGPRRQLKHVGRWLVVATGENAEAVMPDVPGFGDFKGTYLHSSQYKNGAMYKGKKVLVVGSGNSGMEIALDLVTSGADTSIVIRSPFHILPREVFGMSTFSVGMRLLKTLPVWMADYLLVSYSRMVLGDTAACGIKRPKIGPLELKAKMGKTPVLDVGTLDKIRSGDIKVKPAVECLTEAGVKFTNNSFENFDAVIFATGYKSNVLRWLKDKEKFFGSNSMPRQRCPYNWKGKNGLYVAGLSNKGILGATTDAMLISEDLYHAYFDLTNRQTDMASVHN